MEDSPHPADYATTVPLGAEAGVAAIPDEHRTAGASANDLRLHPNHREGADAALTEQTVLALIAQLINRRKDLGLTQAQLAERIGTSQRTISQLENFRINPKMGTVLLWAGALGLNGTWEEVD